MVATGENERLAGRYRVIEQLGRGGMGVVWRAVDEVLGREVAVKELRAYNDASAPELADLRVRMQREARAAARVRHPGVVAVHDVADHEGRPVIVMELVDGPSLDAVLTEKGLLDPHEAAALGARVLEALGAAHRVGVLHRDVKPGNILLDESGRIVLTDFGIAAMDDPGDGSTTHLTRSGELVGSLDYLAPERAQGQEPGPASDVWALGATLYTAVEGGSPFRRTSTWSTLTAIVVDPLPEPVRSGPLGPVLQRLMSKDPAQRPDAVEAARLLTAIAGAGPAGPAPRSAHEATGPHAQQPPSQGAFGPAVPPAAATGTPAPAPYLPPAPGFGPPAPPPPGDYGPGQGRHGTGAHPAAHPSFATGPRHLTEDPGHLTGPTPSAGPQDRAAHATAAVATSGGGGRRGRAAPAGRASGARRKALVASGVAAVLVTGAGVTYALGDRGSAQQTAGSPAAKSSQAADTPHADGLPAIESLPTDAAQKTAAPTSTGKDKGREAGRKTPTPTPGGTKPGSPSSGTDDAGSGGGTGARTADNGSAGADPAGGAAGSPGKGTAAGGSAGGAAATGGGNPPPQPPPAAPVCQGIGAGKYNCEVWRTSDSIRANGERAGTLNAGTNYFYCQADLGRRVTYGNWTNVWWARTDDDNGNTGVYVSVVYLKGGDNDRPLPGLPTC
ncbi:serine/threonine-protein kinase [Streptomyces sp. CA-294286]|uniref:serine/threonine-protein kinase n=1 Tax=Streptomyces sp. CA-294286 TaxID=3240070 RepID=UPI003D94BF50